MNNNLSNKLTTSTDNYYLKMNRLENTISFIRDFLRDKRAITGIKCFEHCCIFFFIRFLNKERVEYLELNEVYIFENFIKELDKMNSNNGRCQSDIIDFILDILYNDCVKELINAENFDKELAFTDIYQLLKKLETMINPVDYENEFDLVGKIYELHLKTGAMGGRDVGQFFTRREFADYMAGKISYNQNGSGRMCDPAMGTSGFLTQFKVHNPYFSHDLVYGIEKDKATYKCSQFNYWFSTGIENVNFKNTDSLCSNVESNYYQYILANPPFGVKGLIYERMDNDIQDLKIKSSKSDCLFVQKIYNMLEENGEALIILPNGFFQTNNRDYMLTRKLLLEKTYVKGVYNLPKKLNYNGSLVDAFENTSVNVSVLHFIRKVVDEDYNVSFINLDENLEEKLIEDIPRSILKSKDFKLTETTQQLNIRKIYSGCRIVKLGDISNFYGSGNRKSSEGKDEGLYPLYFCSILKHLYLDTFDYDNEMIIINKTNGSGKCQLYYINGKYSVAQSTEMFNSNNKEVLTSYIFYYLKNNKEDVEKFYEGTLQKQIQLQAFKNYEIPIPSMETQLNIVNKYLENENRIKMLKQQILDLQNDAVENIFDKLTNETMTPEQLQEPIINEPEPQSSPSSSTTTSSRTRKKSPLIQLEQLELTKDNLNKLKKKQLIEICKSKNIKSYSSKKKEKLIEMILN